MRYSKILIASLPLMLVGCLDVFDDSDDFYAQPDPVTVQATAPVAAPVPPAPGQFAPPPTPPGPGRPFKPKPPKTSDCGCPSEEAPRPVPVVPVVPCPTECSNPSDQPVDPEWHPKEGLLVQAGEHVMELQRKNGNVRPSHAAMCAHIQAKMGLTAPQAQVVLEEMGL
jgi:hypothetical protein